MLFFRNFLVSSVVVALVGSCLTPEAAAKPAHPRRMSVRKRAKSPSTPRVSLSSLHGKILYQAGENLRAISADGGDDRLVIKSFPGANDFRADMKQVVYTDVRAKAEPYEGNNLWIASADGTHRCQLVPVNKTDYLSDPRFSPDGRRILYTRWTGAHMGGPMTASADIWVINADGTGRRRVIGDYWKMDYARYGARWSRDGRRIFYLQVKDGIPETSEIPQPQGEPMSVGLDGKGARSAAGELANYLLDGISPDRRKRVVWDLRNKEGFVTGNRLAIQNVDGSDTRTIVSDDSFTISDAAWSPDGKRIVCNGAKYTFANGIGTTSTSIRMVNVDGSGLKTLVSEAQNAPVLLRWVP